MLPGFFITGDPEKNAAPENSVLIVTHRPDYYSILITHKKTDLSSLIKSSPAEFFVF